MSTGTDTDQSEQTPEVAGPPWVIIEHLTAAGHDLVRVVGWTQDQTEAHQLASNMARAGLHVWLVDLWGEDGKPSVERYITASGAVWLHGKGLDPGAPDAGSRLTDAGR